MNKTNLYSIKYNFFVGHNNGIVVIYTITYGNIKLRLWFLFDKTIILCECSRKVALLVCIIITMYNNNNFYRRITGIILNS